MQNNCDFFPKSLVDSAKRCNFAAMNAQRSSKIPQQSRSAATPKVQEDRFTIEAGKFCLDIAKLIFAGVVLAGLMKEDIEFAFLFCYGIMAAIFFMVLGFIIIAPLKK